MVCSGFRPTSSKSTVSGIQVIGVIRKIKNPSMGMFIKFLTFVRKNMNCISLVKLSLSLVLPSAMRLSVGQEDALSFGMEGNELQIVMVWVQLLGRLGDQIEWISGGLVQMNHQLIEFRVSTKS